MGRIALDELDNYGNNGNGGSFFKLSNDKEVARVRLMLNKPEDLENYIYGVHDVEVDGKHRYVNCLRSYDEPIDKCPFCADKKKVIPKILVPLYNEDLGEVQVWDRGKKFMSTLSSFMSRYSKPTLVSHIVEIERNGKPKDMQTTYQLYEVDKDDTKLEDLPEPVEVLGGIILDKTEDDMNYYLEAGEFPPEDDEEQPIRRRGKRAEVEEEEPEEDIEEDSDEEEELPKRRSSRRGSEEKNTGRRTPGKSRRSF